MGRAKYDSVKEHEVVGEYPAILSVAGNWKVPVTPKLWRPVPTVENYRMLFQGKKPYWIPEIGWTRCDVNEFRPRQQLDNLANRQCFDGGGDIDFEAIGDTLKGWFDIPYWFDAGSGGAMVKPGAPLLEDMNDWESVLVFPDLDAIDWKAMAEMNKEYLGTDRVNQLGIQFGYWERMMNLMDVENAAVALLDDDQEDSIHAFLSKLTDLYIDYIDRVCSIGRIDSVFLHDDWGTSTGPFFSLETCRQFFVPETKRLIDHIHSKGIVFEHHCCGKAQDLVPAMVEEGADYWFPQQPLNDVDMLIEQYADEKITFALAAPDMPKGSSEAQVREAAFAFVEKYKDAGILYQKQLTKDHDPALYAIFRDAVYEYSRIAYQDEAE